MNKASKEMGVVDRYRYLTEFFKRHNSDLVLVTEYNQSFWRVEDYKGERICDFKTLGEVAKARVFMVAYLEQCPQFKDADK